MFQAKLRNQTQTTTATGERGHRKAPREETLTL